MTYSTRFRLALGLLAALSGAPACKSHPDIRGDNSEAQEWAEQQKKEPREPGSQLPPYRGEPPPAAPVPQSPPDAGN